ncbi:CpsB/CapC family capsule biosynthesis tyrosine phosphatase [Petrocella sp. FN5]|uniref:CpsB/CapC family capsule biosynthesis tyrosine phosphatase n=1 Tax=Petrocella sp. FN5 TaxID=3032002 RepID=UPI0023DA8A8E|nr:CpsB/CapC family capsule biosynthesis tyrosine phosphatase [Petrocella sp. FN5]MDF1616964.1 hypothetical protein [Petrocella sp. FN5]
MKLYDMHYHLIPGVDDGPDTPEQALDMVKTSYDQGVRGIVATPHLNHPAEFRGNKSINQDMNHDFEVIRTRIQQAYPEMEVYQGAEIYLSKKDLNHLDQVKIRTMNDTRYILVEFSRDITFVELDHGLHELMLLGYQPILAHAEVYRCFTDHMEELMKLREQGTLIQCSAGNIIDFQKRPEKIRASKMLGHGLVDMIASDGHNMDTRRPDIGQAYAYVKRKYGIEEAQRLFQVNIQTMLTDGIVPQPSRVIHKFQPKKKKVAWMASLMTIGIFGIGLFITGGLNAKEEPLNQPYEQNIDYRVESSAISKVEELQVENLEHQQEQEDTMHQEEALEIPTNKTRENMDPLLDGYNRIVQAYQSYLTELETHYKTQVDIYFTELKEASKIEDSLTREETIKTIRARIGKLESRSDNEVYKSLYDLQNDLEDHQYDVAVVQQLRDHYKEVKVTVSEAYQKELEAHYSKQ